MGVMYMLIVGLKMSFKRDRYARNELVPWWKGIVCYDVVRNENVVAPVIFNVFYRWVFGIWIFIKWAQIDLIIFRREQEQLRNEILNNNQEKLDEK